MLVVMLVVAADAKGPPRGASSAATDAWGGD
jgi:hypothetical protein